jgi:hypothetical protein
MTIGELTDSLHLIEIHRTQSEYHLLESMNEMNIKELLRQMKLTKAVLKVMNKKSKYSEIFND